ncbi:MAG: GNAT family N-acetyltransferase [Sporichthyaceae bacterium]
MAADTRDGSEPREPPWRPLAAPARCLDGLGLTLSAWTGQEADALYAAIASSREHLLPWMGWAQSASPDNTTKFLASAAHGWADRSVFEYRIGPPGGGPGVLGACGLMARTDPGELEIGYWVRVDVVGRQLATRATALLVRAGLALAGVERILIRHHPDNAHSRAVPQRLGFRLLPGTVDGPPGSGERHCGWVLTAADMRCAD